MIVNRKKIFPPSVILAAILVISISVSCDNTLNPIDKEEGIYSLYGFIDVNEDVNYIRVKDFNIPLLKDTTSSINAAVTLTDLKEGTSEILQDTIITFDGVPTHNFKASRNIKPETTYQITVEGSEGRHVSATTNTPNIAATKAKPINENCLTPIIISYNPVNAGNTIQMQISFKLYDNTYNIGRVLNTSSSENNNEMLSTTITPSVIMKEAFCKHNPFNCSLPLAPCYLLDSEYLRVNYTQFGPDYKLGSNTSNVSDSLTIPGGSGRFIGLLRDSFSFPIDTLRVEGF